MGVGSGHSLVTCELHGTRKELVMTRASAKEGDVCGGGEQRETTKRYHERNSSRPVVPAYLCTRRAGTGGATSRVTMSSR